MARPTKSRQLYVQMIGRGTRGKTDCIVIDLLGNSRRHKLMTISTLAGLGPELMNGRTVVKALRDGEEEANLIASRGRGWRPRRRGQGRPAEAQLRQLREHTR